MSTIVSRYVSGPIRSALSIVISQIPHETGAVAILSKVPRLHRAHRLAGRFGFHEPGKLSRDCRVAVGSSRSATVITGPSGEQYHDTDIVSMIRNGMMVEQARLAAEIINLRRAQ